MKKRNRTRIWIHLFFILFGLLCILPLMVVISASFSNEVALIDEGFGLLPRKFELTAYAYLFENPEMILNAYGVTIFITVVGTFGGVLCMSMCAYCLSRRNCKFRKALTFFVFFPTLFSGGMVPSYIINTQYLHLSDNIFSMILPTMINVFHVIMLRTFFKELPESLFEAAKIDGASEYRIFFQIVLALSKPALATIAFLGALDRWNEWYNAMLYIKNEDLVPLQYMLQRMMMNIQTLLQNMSKAPGLIQITDLPGENLRMAMLVVSIGPMLLVFPFFQKYFTKGLTVGSVKG